MYPSNLRKFINYNVLTTAEVGEILQITKQRIVNLVKSEELLPVKQTTQGMLFLRADIEAYRKKKNYGIREYYSRRYTPIYDYSGSTNKSINFFENNRDKLGEISAIFIYFDEYDAALDNFYIPSEDEKYGELQFIDSPHMVIRDTNGQEIWLGGCNCGYGGEGPHGSIHILEKMKKEKDIILDKKELDEIKYNRIVKIFKESDGTFEIIAHDSPMEKISNNNSNNLNLFLFRNNLVLVEDTHSMWNRSNFSDLEKYKDFIPEPVQVKLFNTYDQAREEGYVKLERSFQDSVYRLIIFDASGRQIWLNPIIDDTKPLKYQNNLVEILNYCGFDVEDEKLSEKLQRWLKKTIIKIPTEPIIYKK